MKNDYRGYINTLRSKNLTMSANRENGFTLDTIPIQEFNLQLIKDCVEELEKLYKVRDEENIFEELALRMLETRLNWYKYVATGELQNDFWKQHSEEDRRTG